MSRLVVIWLLVFSSMKGMLCLINLVVVVRLIGLVLSMVMGSMLFSFVVLCSGKFMKVV